jgi:molybdopterin-guanine dinucleotide biosynthesis protein B
MTVVSAGLTEQFGQLGVRPIDSADRDKPSDTAARTQDHQQRFREMTDPVVGVAGWKNSGKTTLVTKLVAELSRRGYRVATVKHAHHQADIDHEGTDSFRHRSAGASEVALVTSARWAVIHELRGEPEPPLSEILARLSPADLVIVEGYKQEPIPKIEVRRRDAARSDPLGPDDGNIIALAGDTPSDANGRPFFDLDRAVEIADFLVAHFDLAKRHAGPPEGASEPLLID